MDIFAQRPGELRAGRSAGPIRPIPGSSQKLLRCSHLPQPGFAIMRTGTQTDGGRPPFRFSDMFAEGRRTKRFATCPPHVHGSRSTAAVWGGSGPSCTYPTLSKQPKLCTFSPCRTQNVQPYLTSKAPHPETRLLSTCGTGRRCTHHSWVYTPGPISLTITSSSWLAENDGVS